MRRLVMDVSVRRGQLIVPSDDSEGTRDRPPTSEAEQNQGAAIIEQIPATGPANGKANQDIASSPNDVPATNSMALDDSNSVSGISTLSPPSPTPNYTSLRWGSSLASLAIATGGVHWSRKVDAAFAQADRNAWQRLRRAGLLGRADSQDKRTNPDLTKTAK